MNIRRINDMFAATSQPVAKDVQRLASMGFKTIICNRPDGEESDQTEFAKIAVAAEEKGMITRMLPVSLHGASTEDQKAFDRMIFECPKPVIAYCHSGTRSVMLWSEFNIEYNYKYTGPERRGKRSGGSASDRAVDKDGKPFKRRMSDYSAGQMDRSRRIVAGQLQKVPVRA